MDNLNSDLSEDTYDGYPDFAERSDDGFEVFSWESEEQSASSLYINVGLLEYSRLQLEPVTSIRLLALKPRLGGRVEDVECELRDVDFHAEECPKYEALSYTWGNQSNLFRILVNGQILRITENLIHALRNLRHQEQERLLWVDAICINQSDEEEKTHQVRHMGEIYKRAECVVVWLGDSDQEEDLVFEFVNMGVRDNEHVERLKDLWANDSVPWPKKDVQISLTYLLRHPWFRRVWVIQEVAQSRSANIMRGHHSVKAATFAQLPDLLGVRVDRHCQQVFNVMPGMRCAQVSQAADFSQDGIWIHRSLRTLLGDFRDSHSTEPKDKIFALLGLSTEHKEASARLSYSELEHDFVRGIIVSLIPGVPWEELPSWTLSKFWAALDSLENSLLEWAFKKSFAALTKELVNTGVLSCVKKYDVLSFAARNDWSQVVALLLETGNLDPNLVDEVRLDWRAEVGFDNVVQSLLKKAMFYLDSTGQSERLPVRRATGDAEQNAISRWLEKDETNCDFTDDKGRTPLSWAAGYHYGLWMVEALLKAGKGNVESRDQDGRTPLMWAVQTGNVNTVRILLDTNEASSNIADRWGNTPLRMAVKGKRLDCAALLLEKCKKPHGSPQTYKRSSLWWAIGNGQIDMVRLLLKTGGISPGKARYNEWEPLGHAFDSGRKDIGNLLRKYALRHEENLWNKENLLKKENLWEKENLRKKKNLWKKEILWEKEILWKKEILWRWEGEDTWPWRWEGKDVWPLSYPSYM